MGFDDVVLPLFDQPAEPIVRPPSAKEAEANLTPRYAKHSGRTLCDDCVKLKVTGKQKTISVASYARTLIGNTIYLCYRHTQERKHRDGIR